MAQPFTSEQLTEIRARLFDSACHHALATGFKKTSLDMLTADAGISKSSFYKFYDSKELLFLEVAGYWESQVIGRALCALKNSEGKSNKERAADAVFAAFEAIHQMGIARFLREDLPVISSALPHSEAKKHYLSSAETIFHALRNAQIRFSAPEDIVLSVIQLMYLSILNIRDIGDSFFPALHALVIGACDNLVA